MLQVSVEKLQVLREYASKSSEVALTDEELVEWAQTLEVELKKIVDAFAMVAQKVMEALVVMWEKLEPIAGDLLERGKNEEDVIEIAIGELESAS